MTQEYANKLVRRNFIALILTLIFMALLAVGAVGMWWGAFGPPDFMRKDNSMLTPQAAELRLENGATASWDKTTHTVPKDAHLSALLRANQWTSSAAFDGGEADLTFRFGERYKLSLWSDGRAAFYDGYAGRSTKSHAYYSIPAGVVGELTAALAVSAPA